MKQYLVLALVFAAILAMISAHPLEEQKITLEDAEAQPGIDDGTGVRAARHFGGFRRGGYCCGGGGGYRPGGFGGGGGYPRGGFGGGSASASASASASSSWGRK